MADTLTPQDMRDLAEEFMGISGEPKERFALIWNAYAKEMAKALLHASGEIDELRNRSSSVDTMLEDQRDAAKHLLKERDQALSLLRPFAALYEHYRGVPDGVEVKGIRVSDLRTAARVVQGEK